MVKSYPNLSDWYKMFIPHLLQAGKSKNQNIRRVMNAWRKPPVQLSWKWKVLSWGGSTNIRSRWILNKNIFALTHEWIHCQIIRGVMLNVATLDSVAPNLDDEEVLFHQMYLLPGLVISYHYPLSRWNGHLFWGWGDIYIYSIYKIPVQIPCCPTDLAIDTTWYDWHCLGPAYRSMRLLNISSSCHGNTACYLAHLWRLRYEHQRYLQHVQVMKVMSACIKSGWKFASEAQAIHFIKPLQTWLILYHPCSCYT